MEVLKGNERARGLLRYLSIIVTVLFLMVACSAVFADSESDALLEYICAGIRDSATQLCRGSYEFSVNREYEDKSSGQMTSKKIEYSVIFSGEMIRMQKRYRLQNINNGEIRAVEEDYSFDGREARALSETKTDMGITKTPRDTIPAEGRFHERIIRPSGYDICEKIEKIQAGEASPDRTVSVERVLRDGEEMFLVTTRNTDTDGSNLFWIDPNRGFYCTYLEWRQGESVMLRRTTELEKLESGLFFPVKSVVETFDDKQTLQTTYAVNRDTLEINEREYPQELFTIQTEDGMEISDWRGGLRLKYYQGNDAVADLLEFDKLVEEAKTESEKGPSAESKIVEEIEETKLPLERGGGGHRLNDIVWIVCGALFLLVSGLILWTTRKNHLPKKG